MLKLSLLAAGLTAALGACGTDDSEPNVTTPPAPVAFKLRIENIAPWTVLKSGTQQVRTDGTQGPIGPGQAYEIAFTAGKNQKVSFASMLGQSNDWFFAPSAAGIALYDANGNPRTGDVTSEVYLWDAGTEIDQEPAVGNATGPRQPSPEYGDPDPVAKVRQLGNVVALTGGGTFTLPNIAQMVRVTLTPGANRQFTLRIENVSTATTLVTSQGNSGIGMSPPVWTVHARDAALFDLDMPDRNQGLELIAESGRNAVLGANLRTLSGAATPISPGVYAVHRDAEPLYALGLEDLGIGLSWLAEDGNAMPLHEAITNNTRTLQFSATGNFDTPVGADKAGAARPGNAFEITVEGVPGDKLSWVSMFGMSNDWFFGTRPEGIALFDEYGEPVRGDVSRSIAIYDAGTELDQELGIGADTGPQQSGPNTGAADPIALVREVTMPASAHLRVTLEPIE
jgi:hypothetical protein